MNNSKTIAWIGIPLLSAASLTIVNTISQGALFEGKKATAAYQAAMAELEKAKAEMQKAVAALAAAAAAKLDAENKYRAAVEMRDGQLGAAQITAGGTVSAAHITSQGLVAAANVDKYVDNTMYDSFVAPIIGPLAKVGAPNEQIVRIRRELGTGIDQQTGRFLSEEDRADLVAKKLILEEEVSMLKETSAKNFTDNVGALMGGLTQGLGQTATFYPSGNEPAPVRRIIQEP